MKLSDIPDEQLASLRANMRNELHLLMLLMPGVDSAFIDSKVDSFIEESLTIAEQIWPSFIEPARLKAYPYMQLVARHAKDPDGQTDVAISIVKEPGLGASGEDVVAKALLIAFLLSPVARLFLILSGYTYHFMDVKQLVKKPTIIT